jgi:hypothetical protein
LRFLRAVLSEACFFFAFSSLIIFSIVRAIGIGDLACADGP